VQIPVQRTITHRQTQEPAGLRTYVQLFTVIAHAKRREVRRRVQTRRFVYAYGFAEDIDAQPLRCTPAW